MRPEDSRNNIPALHYSLGVFQGDYHCVDKNSDMSDPKKCTSHYIRSSRYSLSMYIRFILSTLFTRYIPPSLFDNGEFSFLPPSFPVSPVNPALVRRYDNVAPKYLLLFTNSFIFSPRWPEISHLM